MTDERTADQRGGRSASRGYHNIVEPHESPWTMTVPLVILALFAIFLGFINTPFAHLLGNFLLAEAGEFNLVVAGVAVGLALAGVVLGWTLYHRSYTTAHDSDPLERMLPRVFGPLNRKLGFDELYAFTFGLLVEVLAFAWVALDRVLGRVVSGVGSLADFVGRLNFVVDDTLFNDGADTLAEGTNRGGDRVRRIETGRIQDYVGFIFGGVVVLGVVYLYLIQR